jgi:hypothetical protein
VVSHSGASLAGEFLYTLDYVDIQTGWVERQVARVIKKVSDTFGVSFWLPIAAKVR